MSRVPSIPDIPGIATSTTATSGQLARASRMASRPSVASAITWMSLCPSITARIPARTRLWSSTSITLIDRRSTADMVVLQRQLGDDLGPFEWRRTDFERSAEQRGALAHPKDAQAGTSRLLPLGDASWIESDAVVANPEPDVAIEAAQVDVDAGGLRVFIRVGQRFLCDPVESRLDRRRQAVAQPIDLERDLGSGGLLGQRTQRRDQAEIVEHRGPQVLGHAVHLLERFLQRSLHRLQLLARLGIAGPLQQQIQADDLVGQRLAGLIV